MEKQKILNDIARIYSFVSIQNKETNAFYQNLNSPIISDILQDVLECLMDNDEVRFACVERIVGLKEAAILNVFNKYKIDEKLQEKLRKNLFIITRDFHTSKHKEILNFIHKNTLLTPFLREMLESVHRIGIAFNGFFVSWQERLILGINKDLQIAFKGDLKAILKALESSFEVCTKDFKHQGGFSYEGEISDRSYSVPILKDSAYSAVAYAEFFVDDFRAIKEAFDVSLQKLENIAEVCKELEQKDAYMNYLKTLKNALLQKDCGELLEAWREVDRAWMEISTPLQIGHPLEYYEDHFRKAVAPEWDLRIARIYEGVNLLGEEDSFRVTKAMILDFYLQYSKDMPNTEYKQRIDQCVQESLHKTQCYGGMPMLFYGAELNGLFSAQVVPNDEEVSKKYGKKIFYFPDRVREISIAKPFMQLSKITFPKEFLDFNRELLYFRAEDWYKIYEIATVGHEFGHILWVDVDSELKMNLSGQFKNIEEFKATMGGLAFYFCAKDKPLLKELIFNTIARAVGLIAWQKENEVLPYYCEGLIHLHILFLSGVLRYKGDFNAIALDIIINDITLQTLQKCYLEVYNTLIVTYLHKQDAKNFLEKFVKKDNDGYYKPIHKEVCDFVEDYYKKYEEIGQLQDSLTPKQWQDNYIRMKENYGSN